MELVIQFMWHDSSELKSIFLDEVAPSKLNLHGEFLGSKVTLVCLRQSTRTCVIHGQARYPFFCFRSKRVDRCVGVEHEEYLEAVDLTSHVGTIPAWLASYFLV